MSKVSSSFSQISLSKKLLFLTVVVMLFGLSTVVFSVYSQENVPVVETEAMTSEIAAAEKRAKKSCCGEQSDGGVESYTLIGTYYSLKDGQDTILMFNNKGPAPLTVNPVFFSLSGVRLELPAIIIPATSYQELNARDLLAGRLPQFEEGSLQVTHAGAKLQLGVQIKILKLGQKLIFDEQFIQTSRFVSSRLESMVEAFATS